MSNEKPTKRIAAIGVSDEETAHLRLLMRKAVSDLSHAWRWGSESGADLLVADPSSLAGQMARTRAQATGMRCAVFSDERVVDSDLVLQHPLKLANVVAVLNRAAGMTGSPEGIVPHKPDFYFRDVEDGGAVHPALDATQDAPASSSGVAPSLDDLLRAESEEAVEAIRIRATLDEETTVFGTSGPTARSEVRGREGPDILGRPRGDAPAESVLGHQDASRDLARHSLRVYLDGDILGGPARAMLPDTPPLVLDPKQKVYHSPGRLADLEPYCRTALRPSDWQPLTTAELAEFRTAQPPQPYQRLIWLYVLVHSEGQLARHLDPGGTYRLKHWIEIERDFSSYFRIASTMLQPGRLHEIAAASGAAMADVFDAVNAFESIGLIEWQPRARRSGGGEAKPARPSLLGRLRRSLKRS